MVTFISAGLLADLGSADRSSELEKQWLDELQVEFDDFRTEIKVIIWIVLLSASTCSACD